MFTNNSEIKRIIEVQPFEIQFQFIESHESEIISDSTFTMLYNDNVVRLTVRYPELLDEIIGILKKRIDDRLKIEIWRWNTYFSGALYLGALEIKKFMVLDNCIMMRCTTPKYGPMEDWIYEGTPKKIEYNRYGISTDSETLLSIYY